MSDENVISPTDWDKIRAFREREKAFLATPVGKAFNQFKNAYAKAIDADRDDKMPFKRLAMIDRDAKEAERKLREEIEALLSNDKMA
jgi:hypothetical protein